jgi:hypothetical protein
VVGYINPSTGQPHNAERSNRGTFTGALCFFAGALLRLPERTEQTSGPVTTPAASDTSIRRQRSARHARRPEFARCPSGRLHLPARPTSKSGAIPRRPGGPAVTIPFVER